MAGVPPDPGRQFRVTREPETAAVRAVGAGGDCILVGETVALACAVAPPAPVATTVNATACSVWPEGKL